MEGRQRSSGRSFGSTLTGATWARASLMLVLVVGVFPPRSASVLCPLHASRVLATDLYTYFFSSDAAAVTASVRSEECRINSSVVVPVGRLPAALTDASGRAWHPFGFRVDDSTLRVRLGDDPTDSLAFSRSWEDLSLCSSVGLEFSFPAATRLAWNCSAADGDLKALEDATQWKRNCTVVVNTILSDFYDLESDGDDGGADDPSRDSPGYSGGHIIFLPLGAIVIVVTVCLRFCLCPKRGLTAAAPRRSLPTRRRLSLRSEAGGSLTSVNYDLDLPPAYSEVENEDTPPPYSEVEKVRLHTHEEPPPPFVRLQLESEGHHAAGAPSASSENDLSPPAESSGLVKVLTSRPRTLQSQFSHKPLEEEKPSQQT